MTYIKLSNVMELLNEYPSSNTNKIICALPESIDFEKMIQEMIEELIPQASFGTSIIDSYKIEALQELLNKLP